MAFKDLDELLGSPRKQLPVGGKMYEFPDRVSARTGLMLLRLSQEAKANPEAARDGDALVAGLFEEADWETMQTEVLGRPAEEFIGEGLTGDQVSHIFKTLITWHLYGQDAAEKAWESAGNPPAPNRATRRSKAAVKSNQGRGSRGGSMTRAPAAAAAKKTSPGKRSSTGGRS